MTRNKKLVRLMALTVAATTVATAVPAYAAFDAAYYAKQNPDVVAVVGNTPKALEQHYNTFGKNEGRAASADDLSNSPLRKIFDAAFYAKQNPDVVAVFGNDADALFKHFMTFGIKEGRQLNQFFDVNAYKAAYPDLAAAFGDNIEMYYQHFATFGQKEHRTLGGFPSENILPGKTAATATASSGGSSGGSGGSSGGGSSSSGGSSSGAVTPAPSKIPNISPEQAAVNSQVAAAEASLAKASSPNATTQDKLDAVNATSKALDAATTQKAATAQAVVDAGQALSDANDALTTAKGKFSKYADFKTEVDAVGTALTGVNTADKELKEAEIAAAKATNEYNKAQSAYNNAVSAYNTAYNAAVAAVNTAGKDGYIDLETTQLTDATSVKAALADAKTEIQKDMQTANKDKSIADLKDLAVGSDKVSDYLNADGSVNTTKQQKAVAEAQTKAVNALKEDYVTTLVGKATLTSDEQAELIALFGNEVIDGEGKVVAAVATTAKIKEVAPNVANSKLSASDIDTAKTTAADTINKPINDYAVALKRDAVDKANTDLNDTETAAFDPTNGALKNLTDKKSDMNDAKGAVQAKEAAKTAAETILNNKITARDEAYKAADPALTDAEKAEANAYYEAQKNVAKAEADVNNADIADDEANEALTDATQAYADAVALITP